jgi:Protein of unknown function (DUF3277)
MAQYVYSFLDILGAVTGPGMSFSIGMDEGIAEEGITIAMDENKNTKTMGADGSGMHSLHAGKGGSVTIRTLKTSPLNYLLDQAYSFQTTSSANHGQNVISIRDVARGDSFTAQRCAFRKLPDNINAKDGGTMEWVFDAIIVDMLLGNGAPAVT